MCFSPLESAVYIWEFYIMSWWTGITYGSSVITSGEGTSSPWHYFPKKLECLKKVLESDGMEGIINKIKIFALNSVIWERVNRDVRSSVTDTSTGSSWRTHFVCRSQTSGEHQRLVRHLLPGLQNQGCAEEAQEGGPQLLASRQDPPQKSVMSSVKINLYYRLVLYFSFVKHLIDWFYFSFLNCTTRCAVLPLKVVP